jgi:hypothetical protein
MDINNDIPFGLAYGGDALYVNNNNRIHIFNNSGILNITSSGTFNILLVGGGASGDVNVGGGGGGVLYLQNVYVNKGNIPITIGNGGVRYPNSTDINLRNGGNTSFGSLFTATGGKIGTHNICGGTCGTGNSPGLQGYNVNYSYYYGAAGGGAAGGVPLTQRNQYNPNGMDGLSYNITGTSVYYGGGGGGTGCNIGYDGIGGLGGGGSGIYHPYINSQSYIIDGQPNSGGGGGACGNSDFYSGQGGSGIAIISYPDVFSGNIKFVSSNLDNTELNYTSLSNIPININPTSSVKFNNINPNTTTYDPITNTCVIRQNDTNDTSTLLYLLSPTNYALVNILVIGGGGGGSTNGIFGNPPGNGGGSGQVIYIPNYTLYAAADQNPQGTLYRINIGSGGLPNQNGLLSSFGSSFTSIVAYGGKAGAADSGGTSGNNLYGGAYFVEFINNIIYYRGAGGGGATTPGSSSGTSISGLGGDGIKIQIGNTNAIYACGGGGGALRSSEGWIDTNIGANGGSGNANNNRGGDSINNAQSASPNTGGGGGGAGEYNDAGSGGSGIVIIQAL